MASPSKGKGKAPARGSGSNEQRRRALQRALARHYEKKKRRAGLNRMLDDTDPLDALQPIDDEPSTDEEDTCDGPVPGSEHRSEDTWDAMIRANEAMSKELAHLRAMNDRNNQLTNGATPGASGSRACGSAPNLVDGQASHTNPVASGQPALNNPPACSPLRARSPPPAPESQGPRRFVPLPKSKTRVMIEDIQEQAGLGDDHPRWLEIGNIIRDLMTRVGMDYSNSWLRQDKSQMGILYSLILKEAPELGVFQNGWATEWLVQNKFNNHRYYMGKNRRQRHTGVGGNEQGHHPPPPPEPTPPQASRQPSPPPWSPASRPGSLEPAPPQPLPLPSCQHPPPPPSPEPTSPRPSHLPSCSDSAPRSSPPASRQHPQPPLLREPPPPPPPLPQPRQAPPPPEPPAHQPSHPRLHSDSAPRPPPDPSTSSRLGGSRASCPPLSNSHRAPLRISRDGDTTADPTGSPLGNGNPGIPNSRYNLRTRATAAAAAEAQTTTAVKEVNQKRKATGRVPQRGKKQPRKSDSPLRPVEESDDGARSTDEDT